MTEYIDLLTVSNVLAQRSLAVVRGVDGRDPDREVVARLSEISGIAEALCLPDADRFAQLAGAAASGNVRDLARAALTIL